MLNLGLFNLWAWFFFLIDLALSCLFGLGLLFDDDLSWDP